MINKFLWPNSGAVMMRAASQANTLYTDDELQTIIDSGDKTDAELAAQLGRTVEGIKRKRRDLERRAGIGYQLKEKTNAVD